MGGSAPVSSDPYSASVTLRQVVADPAVTTVGATEPTRGGHLVGLVFTVTNDGSTAFAVGGQEHETNLQASVVTSDDQMLNPLANVATLGCDDLGSLVLQPGGTGRGCEVFDLDRSAVVIYVFVQMYTGVGGTYGSWRVP